MKRATDYTQEELLNLDEAELNTLTDIEMMVEGVIDVPAPGPEPVFSSWPKTHPFYTFNGTPFFDTMEAASMAASLSTHVATYESHKSVYSVEKATVQVKLEDRYLAEDLRNVKAEKESFDKKLNSWQSESRSYTAYCRQRDKVESTIFDLLQGAKDSLGKQKKREEQYVKYLSLAGTSEVAARFFLDSLAKDGWSEKDALTELVRIQG